MNSAAEVLARAESVYLAELMSGEPYASARRRAEVLLSQGGIPEGTVRELTPPLAPAIRGGRHERPTLNWYARLLAIRWVSGELAGLPAVDLSRAANFYGDSELAAAVALRARYGETGTAVSLRLWQQEAKALKDQGRFADARQLYREALGCTQGQAIEAETAHFLMLYAKLCHDYQQRQGWYLAFHKIAKERFEALGVHGGLEARWHFIARESYAQALYAHDPVRAEALYVDLLAGCDAESEAYLRGRAHQLRWRLHLLLARGDTPAVQQVLREFGQLPQLARRLRNPRALNVRQVQYLSLAHEVLLAGHGEGSTELSRLGEGEALDRARDAEAGAELFTDRKTLALARVERARWEVFVRGSGPGGYKRARDAAIAHLLRAREAAMGEHEPLSTIYLDVLRQLAECNVELGAWKSAIEHYEQAYDYGLLLKEELEKDEAHIGVRLEASSHGALRAQLPEFQVLTHDELRALREELRIDYRALLDRLLRTAERLHRLREEQTRAVMRTSRELSVGIRYHGMSQRLRKLSEVLERAAPHALPHVEQLKGELESWRNLDDTVFETTVIDLGRAVEAVIKGSVTFERHLDRVTVESHAGHRILFDEVILRYIVENLVVNAYEAASSVRRSDYHIHLRTCEREGLVWLGCEDDVGDYENYAEIVRQVNQGPEVRNSRGANRGRGLPLVRRVVEHVSGVRAAWMLRALEGGGKELLIPLAEVWHDD